jgi:hypothetical protein
MEEAEFPFAVWRSRCCRTAVNLFHPGYASRGCKTRSFASALLACFWESGLFLPLYGIFA